MKIDMRSQMIVAQLNYFYSILPQKFTPMPDGSADEYKYNTNLLNPICALEMVYDLLKEENTDFKIGLEEKEILWSLSKRCFNEKHQSWIKNPVSSKEWLKGKRNDIFKSYIVRNYLMRKFYDENMTMKILDGETNKEIKLITWAQEKN